MTPERRLHVSFNCSECGGLAQAHIKFIGLRVECPSCGAVLRVPSPMEGEYPQEEPAAKSPAAPAPCEVAPGLAEARKKRWWIWAAALAAVLVAVLLWYLLYSRGDAQGGGGGGGAGAGPGAGSGVAAQGDADKPGGQQGAGKGDGGARKDGGGVAGGDKKGPQAGGTGETSGGTKDSGRGGRGATQGQGETTDDPDARRVYPAPELGLTFIVENGKSRIHEVTEGGPADKAGVARDEIILKVDGRDAAMKPEALSRFLAGDVGTRVTLTLGGDDGASRDVPLVRAKPAARRAGPRVRKAPSPSDKRMWAEAKRAVLRMLKDPGSAEFGKLGFEGVSVRREGDGFVVRGSVKAKNALGEVKRTVFECELQRVPKKDIWVVTSTEFVE